MNSMQFEFDEVVKHLYKQGKAAKDADGNCVYRGADGLMCAVGCRIPDSVYVPEMDNDGGYSLGPLICHFGNVLPPEIAAYEEMFSELQTFHDHAFLYSDPPTMLRRLEEIADKFGLTFTPPTEALNAA